MKKFIAIVVLLMMVIGGLSVRLFFFNDKGKEEKQTVVDHQKHDEDTDTDLRQTYPDDVYRMLDFDRRMILKIGQQDKELCSLFNLAYARSILDGKMADPYDYYDGDGAVWYLADYGDIALNDPLPVVLQRAYDEIDAGRPVLLFVSGDYGYTTAQEPVKRISYDHYVLLIGYRMNADYDRLKASDFYAADPSNGYCCSANSYMPWTILSDDAPALVSGEYALYAQIDEDPHVNTCIAYPDKCTWDADISKPIYPEYYDKDR